jgi:hypothetical protein
VVALAALFTAEKGYYAEFETYSQNFLEMGFDDSPESRGCDANLWSIKVYLRRGGQHFVGTATSLLTSERWSINDQKQLKQLRGASSSQLK